MLTTVTGLVEEALMLAFKKAVYLRTADRFDLSTMCYLHVVYVLQDFQET